VRSRRKIDASYGQLRWVILLLAVAVILPTVCLLWFMTQAVENVRMAARQKLITIYNEQLARIIQKTGDKWSQQCKLLDVDGYNLHPYQKFTSIIGDQSYDGLIIYDAEGLRVYPLLSADARSHVELSELFSDAWELEFTEQRFAQAAALYEEKAASGSDYVRLAAIIGKSRCLAKLGKLEDAIQQCKQVAFSELEETGDADVLVLIANARLLLIKFIATDEKYATLFQETFRKLISMIYAANKAGAMLPADHNLFLAQKVLEMKQRGSLPDTGISSMYDRLKQLMAAEERSIRVAGYFSTAEALTSWQTDQFRRLQMAEEVIYGLYHKPAPSDSSGRALSPAEGTTEGTLLLLLSGQHIASALTDYQNSFSDSYCDHRIFDETGNLVAGAEQPTDEPFVTASVGQHLPGWKIELYFKDDDVFKRAANEQIAVYTWTGTLVIALILAAGGFAGQAISRQVKLNKLKNDFIATVSHELKTPLASMRVLVDTLLEGNYRDQRQAVEYLHLVSKENERLSRLIDNFLTFSRMERNKRAFVMIRTSPAAIARTAAEAVKTKFSRGQCDFRMNINENLPDVVADHDAMVTVLVNLLDNAYKYSYDDKRIELKVSSENGSVCFNVSDNGIGMSHRATKKIFRRFYQADRSLSRQAEGCGLGLSIAKFITDAHKGSISVESKLGQGSTFTVRLPVSDRLQAERIDK